MAIVNLYCAALVGRFPPQSSTDVSTPAVQANLAKKALAEMPASGADVKPVLAVARLDPTILKNSRNTFSLPFGDQINDAFEGSIKHPNLEMEVLGVVAIRAGDRDARSHSTRLRYH